MSNELAGQKAPAPAARADAALRAITNGISQTSGGEFYRALALECGGAFGACDVTISELAADGAHTEVLGSWTRSGLPPASGRALSETAAELVMQSGVIHHAGDARAEHPQDDRLARLYAESYLGVPILDGRGDVVGLIELTSDVPGMEMEPAATIIASLASRVVAELERSQAEAALRDSEMRYRTLIEDSFHLVAEIVDERFVFTSAGYGDALGYAPEDVLGGSLYDLIHPDDRRGVAADLQAMVAQRRSARFTVRMQHKDGSWRWIESTARAFRASTGEYRTTLFSRDITAQQETEQDLREKERRFRTLVNDLQVGVLLHGPNGEILHANDTCLELLGLSQEQMLGSTPQDVPWELVRDDGTPLPLDEQPEVVVLRTGKSVRDSVVGIKRHDGSDVLWLLVSAEPRTGPDNERQVVVTFTDISLRLAAEEQLRDSEERFRLLAENASDVIIRYAPSGACTWVSPSVEGVTGYAPDEFMALRPDQTVLPEDFARGQEVWDRAVEGWSGTVEYRFPHKDGRAIWLELTSKAVRDAETGAVSEIHMSGRDITARKIAVAELRESEERFRLLAENASDIIVTFAPDGECTWVSPSITTMVGYLPEELIGTYPRFLVHPEDLEETAAKRAEVLASDGITTSVFRFPHKDGHFLWMESKSKSIRDPQTGDVIQIQLTARDVTARKQAEDDVRESEARFRLLAENATDIIARCNPSGICTWISPSIEAVSGFAPHEIIGQQPRAFIHPDDVAAGLEVKQQTLESADSVTATYRFPHKDGGYLWLESTNKAVRAEDGTVIEIQMSARDITARKQAEDDMRESEVRFRTLIQNLGSGVLLLDADATILVANEAAPRLLGLNMDQLVGHTPYDPTWRTVKEDGTEFLDDDRPVRVAIATRQAVHDVVMGVDSPEHDRRIWLLVSAQPLFTPEGGVQQVICSFNDITARLAAESDLREREEQFRLLAEHSTDLIGRYGFDGTCLWISPSSLAITGYAPAELIGKDAAPHFHPDDLPGVLEIMTQMAGGVMNTTSSFRFRRKDGEYIWLEAKNRAICDEHGAIVEVQSTTRDVTARVQREEDMRLSEERFRLLAENATDIIARYDAEGTCLWISPSVTAVTGFLPEEIVGMQLPQLVHRKDAGMLDDASRLMSDGTEAFSTTFRVPHKDGRRIWLEATNRMIRDPETGRVIEIHTSSRDITARKEAEDAMGRSEQLFRATLESTADGILVTKPGGTLLYWNSRAAEMLQIPQDILDRGDATAFVQHVVAQTTDPHGLVRAISALPLDEPANAGSWVGFGGKRFEIYAHPLAAENGDHLRVWSVRDVTSQYDGEIALRESEERLRSLAEHTSDLVLGIAGPGGVIDYASPNAEAILGYTAESLVGTSAMDIVHDEDLARTFEDFQAAAETSTTAQTTLRVRHGNGSLRWFELTSNFFHNDLDELRAVVTARDVTNQKVARDALRESEERLRAVINSAPLALIAVNAERTFILAEGEALRAVGLTSKDLLGTTIDEFYKPFPAVIASFERTLAGESFTALEVLGGITFEAHYEPTADGEGRIAGAICIAYDVSSRVRAEEALRESEETARALLNAPTDGAVLVDREGMILAMNATAERRFNEHAAKQGMAARDFIDTCVYDLFPPDLRDQRRARNDDVFVTGERSHFEDERDGTWTDVTIDPIHDADGNVVRLAIFSRDITDRKRDEAALKKRSRELEALNDYLEKTHTELERSQDELRDASEQLAQLLDAEQARAKTDTLTGVLNHGAISEVITEAIAAEINFAVAMVDVDGMKAVNDTYGHQAGDDVLLAVTNAIGRGGAIVGRYGGDEFVVALLNVDGNEASAYKTAVDAALADAHVIDPESGARVPVVASVGIASYPADAATLPELIERADEEMYAEKRARQGVGTGLSSSRILGSERAARMVGELVPLLTSEETLADKLRLVAHRVSIGGGYAGVNFDVFVEEDDGAATTASQNAFTKAPDELIDEWNRQQRAGTNQTGVGDLLRDTKRPLIIESIAESEYVTDDQRTLLLSIGIVSAIVVPLFSDDEMVATMSVGSKDVAAFGHNDEQFLMAVAGQVAAIIRMARLVEHLQQATDRLESSRDETVMLLAAAAEAHSQAASLHYENVRVVSEAIAVEMGVDAEHVRELGMAAALHDIGKIRVPDSLLSSPERVSPTVGAAPGREEWELLKEHCIHGRDFLVKTTGFELAARIAYTHHERWDGGGYPEGLAGEAIPLESAIIAVADSLDAIMSERSYQAGRPLAVAMAEIVANRGTQFRPDVVDALVAIHERGGLASVWNGGESGEEATAA